VRIYWNRSGGASVTNSSPVALRSQSGIGAEGDVGALVYNRAMQQSSLPPSVVSVAEFLAMKAKGYDNHLKWNEQAMFKADLMNARRRWIGVSFRSVATGPMCSIHLLRVMSPASVGRASTSDRRGEGRVLSLASVRVPHTHPALP
jgi:hypothetical protein